MLDMKYFIKVLIYSFLFFLLGLLLDRLFNFQIYSKNIIVVGIVTLFTIVDEKLNRILELLDNQSSKKEDFYDK